MEKDVMISRFRVRLAIVSGVVALITAGLAPAVASAQELLPKFEPTVVSGSAGGIGYAPPGGGWGLVSKSGHGVSGSRETRIQYTYFAVGDVSIHASALHYVGGKERWTEFGASTSMTSGPLEWGAVIATPSIKFRSLTGLGSAVNWSH